MDDLTYSRQIAEGDPQSCLRFVHDYSDLVLSRVLQLMKSHCHYPAREKSCCLRNIQRQTRDRDYVPGPGQCDECMDSYLWFFEALKRKAGAFRGTNGCSLKTYVWAVLHSKTTYIDWLRWRYGRAF